MLNLSGRKRLGPLESQLASGTRIEKGMRLSPYIRDASKFKGMWSRSNPEGDPHEQKTAGLLSGHITQWRGRKGVPICGVPRAIER